MMKQAIDERTELINGKVSAVVLLSTQVALALAIFYKRYIQHLDTSYTGAFSTILIVSMGIYWGFRLYLSGALPVLPLRVYIAKYFAIVAVIVIPSGIIHGWPTAQNWTNTILPAATVPAIVVFLIWLIAFLGKRRIEKQIQD
jgi:hypothetical protein